MNIFKEYHRIRLEYDTQVSKLTKEYNVSLEALQEECPHELMTDWMYTLDQYGEPSTTEEGTLYKARQCQQCGLVEKAKPEIYDSEPQF